MSEQTLKAYVPREIISLGLSPLDTLALLVLSSLPYGLYGTQQWFAELLQKDKAQMSRTIKSLRKSKLIYEDFRSGESVIKVNNDEVLKIYAERLAKGLIKERSQDKGLLAPKSDGSDNYAQDDNNTKNANCGKTCGKTVGNSNDDKGSVDLESTNTLIKSQQGVDLESTIYTNNKEINNKYIYKEKIQKEKQEDFVIIYDEQGAIKDAYLSPTAEAEFLKGIELLRQECLESLQDPEELSDMSYRKPLESSQAPRPVQALNQQQGDNSSGTELSARSKNSKIHSIKKTGGGRLLTNRRRAQQPKMPNVNTPQQRSPGQSLTFGPDVSGAGVMFRDNPGLLEKFRSTVKGRALLAVMGYA